MSARILANAATHHASKCQAKSSYRSWERTSRAVMSWTSRSRSATKSPKVSHWSKLKRRKAPSRCPRRWPGGSPRFWSKKVTRFRSDRLSASSRARRARRTASKRRQCGRPLAPKQNPSRKRLPASAPGGRVTQEDVKAYVRSLAAPAGGTGALTRPAGLAAPALPDFEHWGPVERRPLDAVRRKTAEHMSLAWSLIPHVTQDDHADITELEAFRKQQEGKGPKLTVTAFALKAAAAALK